MQQIYGEEISYWSLEVPDSEKDWIKSLLGAFADGPLTKERFEAALQLAWKRGYVNGAR